ncbi:MAG: hypothetical protein FJ161_00620 [Gammaproteobacteria bacterium]|nr:hypothetical protein [Gammaproteobacteria bacterium]
MKYLYKVFRIFYIAPLFCQAVGLLTLIDSAKEHALSWKAQDLQSRSNEMTGTVALGSLLPSISLTANQSSGVSYSGAYSYGSTTVPGGNLPYHQTSLAAQVQIPIYTPGALAGYYAADKKSEISTYDYKLFEESFILNLCSQYFNILKSDKALALSREELEMKAKFYSDVSEQYDVGLVAMTDLKEAEAALDLARANEIQAVFQLNSAKEQLVNLIQLTPEYLQDLPSSIDAALLPVTSDRGTHPSLLKARATVDLSQYLVNQAYSGFSPQLVGVTNYSLSPVNQNISHSVSSISAGLSLSWSPPYGATSIAHVQQQNYALQAAQAQLIQTHHDHETQLKIGHAKYDSMLRQIEAQKVAIRAATIYLDAVEASYEAGQRTASDVLAAQSSLTQQRQQLFNLTYDSLTLYLQLGMLHCCPIDDLLRSLDEILTESWNWN